MQFIDAKADDDLNRVLNSGTAGPLTVILPKKATYRQKVRIERNDLTIMGNGSSIVWDDHNGMREGFGTGDSATLTVYGCNVTLKDLSVINSFDYWANRKKSEGDPNSRMGLQAVAVFTRPESTGSRFYNCTLISWQDTLFCDGVEEFYQNCVISGNVDFIFGRAHAEFNACTIISGGAGFVSAPSTMADKARGLEFENCRFTCTWDVEDGSVYLARPWHPSERTGVSSFAAFYNCTLDRHINTALWTDMKDRNGVVHKPEENRFSIDESTGRSL